MSATFESTNARSHDQDERDSGEMSKFFDDVEQLLVSVAHVKDEDAARLRTKVETSLNKAKDTMARETHRIKKSTKAAALATDKYAHEKPWNVVGIAAVAGLLLGAVLLRR